VFVGAIEVMERQGKGYGLGENRWDFCSEFIFLEKEALGFSVFWG
jgi:hypothetical protein